ncbi:MAG: DUF305 domain-containing protein [Pseudolabrys sp.]|nr:DUF305 domain-containing protein [Pseudolabrys sp.]MDP2295505.1 DUF305 domain-containing protein [Pseudolabrys sp.]
MLRTTIFSALAMTMIALATPANAQQSAASKGYMDAMSKMQADMPKDHNSDLDVGFAQMMIPHHQGAIDMAKVELQYGKDPMLRAMAEKMIKDQEKEIADLEKWLKGKGK